MLEMIALATVLSTSADIKFYDMDEYVFVVTDQPGGRTLSQAERQLNLHRPGTVKDIVNAGYFAPDWDPIRSVDLVWSKGAELSPYRPKEGRPIVATGSCGLRIFTGKPGTMIAYNKLLAFKEAGGFTEAYTADYRPMEPTEPRNRVIVGLKDNSAYIIRMYGNEAACLREIAKVGLDIWAFNDGGSSTLPGARVPTHLGVMTK